MAEESVFRGIIEFLDKLGIYDVILPFLLVFTIVFAILDKTKVLGTETIDGNKVTKKNLNAMVAFVSAFFVVASARIVSAINEAVASVALLLILIVCFLLLIGTFFKEGDEVVLEKGWKTFFMISIFVGIVLIFLNALDWLAPFWNYIQNNWQTQWVGSLILIGFIVLFMWWITKSPGSGKKEEGDES